MLNNNVWIRYRCRGGAVDSVSDFDGQGHRFESTLYLYFANLIYDELYA